MRTWYIALALSCVAMLALLAREVRAEEIGATTILSANESVCADYRQYVSTNRWGPPAEKLAWQVFDLPAQEGLVDRFWATTDIDNSGKNDVVIMNTYMIHNQATSSLELFLETQIEGDFRYDVLARDSSAAREELRIASFPRDINAPLLINDPHYSYAGHFLRSGDMPISLTAVVAFEILRFDGHRYLEIFDHAEGRYRNGYNVLLNYTRSTLTVICLVEASR
jgi:hypothetical protein